MHEQLEAAVADDQTSTRELHASLTRRLKELNERESRLIDLAADDTLPQPKIRAKLHEIQKERERARAGLTNTSEELAVGAGVLRDALYLVMVGRAARTRDQGMMSPADRALLTESARAAECFDESGQ